MEEKRDILKDFTEKMEALFGRSLNKIILYYLMPMQKMDLHTIVPSPYL